MGKRCFRKILFCCQINPLIHTLVDDSPLIVMNAGGNEMGDGQTLELIIKDENN